MAINAFFLDLRIDNLLNFSLNHPFFILDAAHDTCTNTERRYLLPLVVAVLLYLPALAIVFTLSTVVICWGFWSLYKLQPHFHDQLSGSLHGIVIEHVAHLPEVLHGSGWIAFTAQICYMVKYKRFV